MYVGSGHKKCMGFRNVGMFLVSYYTSSGGVYMKCFKVADAR